MKAIELNKENYNFWGAFGVFFYIKSCIWSHWMTCFDNFSFMVLPFSQSKDSCNVSHLSEEKLKGAVMQHCGDWFL